MKNSNPEANKLNPEPIVLDIDRLSHDGRGVAQLNGKTVFVFGALANEKVAVKILRKHRRYLEARAEQVLVASKDRVKPICQHFGLCGGCQLQHLDSKKQIEFKQKTVNELLVQQGVLANQWLPPLTGTNTGYRYKARLGVKYVHKKESMLVGFREQASNKIAILDNCEVLTPEVGKKISLFRTLVKQLSCFDKIPQIEVAKDDSKVALVVRHLEELSTQDLQILIDFCKEHDFILFLQSKNRESVKKVWPRDDSLNLSYKLSEQNLSLDFHPLDFTQVNSTINNKMVKQAMDWLAVGTNDIVADLFCGIGNFSLPLALHAKQVIGIEKEAYMVAKASENANKNNLTNIKFAAFDLYQDFDKTTWEQVVPFNQDISKILLDPPRSGAQEIVKNIKSIHPKEILYVSCDPSTFARDAKILQENNYTLDKVGVIDMFPHTKHVETMGLFKEG